MHGHMRRQAALATRAEINVVPGDLIMRVRGYIMRAYGQRRWSNSSCNRCGPDVKDTKGWINRSRWAEHGGHLELRDLLLA